MASRRQDGATAVVGGIAALAVAMGVGRFAYTPILPSMQAGAGFGSDVAGLLAGANHLGYLLGAFAAAALGRGRSRVGVLRLSLLAGLAATAGMALTEDPAIWGILRFVAGLASAGIFVAAAALVFEAAGPRRARISGFFFGGVGIGIALSGALILAVDQAVGWRGDWLVMAGLSVLLILPAWLWLGESAPSGAARATTIAEGAARFPLALLALAYFCEGTGYIVSGTFLVSILKALPETAVYGELAWILVGLAGAPSCLFWAALGRRLGLPGALVTAHLVQAVGIVLPVLSPSPSAALLGAALFGGTFMGITTLAVTLATLSAADNTARAVGLVTAAFGLGQVLGPVAAGLLAEQSGSFDGALTGAAGVVVLGAALLMAGAIRDAASQRKAGIEDVP